MFEPSRLADVMRTVPERKERKMKKAKKRAKLAYYNVRFGIKPNVNQMPDPIKKFNIRHIIESKSPQYYLHDVVMNRQARSLAFTSNEEPPRERVRDRRKQDRSRKLMAEARQREAAANKVDVDFTSSSVQTDPDPPTPPTPPPPVSVQSSGASPFSRGPMTPSELLKSPGEPEDSPAFLSARERLTDSIDEYEESVDPPARDVSELRKFWEGGAV